MNRNCGFSTLTVTLIMLLFITGVTLVTGKVIVTEQRIAGNELRYQEAMQAAQAGLDDAIARLSEDQSWKDSFPQTITGALGAGGSYSVVANNNTPITVMNSTLPLVEFTSTGQSPDGLGTAMVRQQVTVTSAVVGTPDAPLVVASGLHVSGTFTVAANPDGGGTGVPLSIWTDQLIDLTNGSGQTCNQQEFYAGNCSTDTISEKGNKQSDILDSDPNFPTDLLLYVFGVNDDAAGMAELEKRAVQRLTSCSSLNAASTGLIIVDGACNPGGQIGTRTDPVILLVRNGDVTMNGNIALYGMLFTYDSDPSGGTAYDINMNGGAQVFGAAISNHQIGTSNGSYESIYDSEVLNNIQSGQAFASVNKVPGSWRDF